MQYTINMTSRMLAIASLCAFLLCVLLFLLGIELGKRFADPAAPSASLPQATASLPATPSIAAPALPAAPQLPAVQAPAVPAPNLKP